MAKVLPRRIVGICVGVDKPGLLHDLNAAGVGARKFHEWLLSQKKLGVQVRSVLFTETAGAVRRQKILKVVSDLLKKGGCDVLYIYLAGHGVALNAYEERLLLSKASEDGAEAITLETVKDKGQYCGIPHTIIVWDACRSYANTDKLREVVGGPIFPPGSGGKIAGHVDLFMACSRGDSSYEVAPDSGANPKNYRAFFTEALLNEVKNPDFGLLAETSIGGEKAVVIPSKLLEDRLKEKVPKLAIKSVPPFTQVPDIHPGSYMPKEFFSVAQRGELAGMGGSAMPSAVLPTASKHGGDGLRGTRRTTTYNYIGNKPFATRDAAVKLKDIQRYSRAHSTDIRRGSGAQAKAAAKAAATKVSKKKSRRTVMYSTGGKKLYAVLDAKGTLKALEKYSRADAGGVKWDAGGRLEPTRDVSGQLRTRPPSSAPSTLDVTQWHMKRAFAPATRGMTPPSERLVSVAKKSGFDRVAADARRTVGRKGFETHCGFTVLGAEVRHFDVSHGQFHEFVSWESNSRERHFRVGKGKWDARGGTALFQFKEGTGVALAILPGYVGTVLVEGGQVRGINYAPADGTREYRYYLRKRVELEERRAIATAAASVGQLQELSREKGNRLAAFLRVEKATDPCLGVFAAYAYHFAGNRAQVKDIWQWMSKIQVQPHGVRPPVLAPIPFDVAMLAGQLTPRIVHRAPGIAPFCPWLSFGWAMLDNFDVKLHPALVEASRYRLPGTWTSFSKRGMGVLHEAIKSGEVQ